MKNRATGCVTISMKPAAPSERSGRTTLGRMLLEKQYDGDLIATGTGEMLTAVTDTPGSASYVAIEHVTGVLDGKEGSFVLHHLGTMAGGVDDLVMAVVPQSGTGRLRGISGQFTVQAIDGKHHFEFGYTVQEGAPDRDC